MPSQNPLKCDFCMNYMHIRVKKEEYKETIEFRLPYFHCALCNKEYTINLEKFEIYNPQTWIYSYPVKPNWINQYDGLSLKYDFLDNYIIPWLLRQWDDWFLTPVFFRKELLLYYNNHPDYRVIFYSYSSWAIFYKWESFLYHWFGLNSNGNIFFWLWDLDNFFKWGEYDSDLHIFKAHNIDSDHDVVSHYYSNQIEVEFTSSDNELELFSLYNNVNEKFKKRFWFYLFRRSEDIFESDYKQPLLEDKQSILESYSKLSQLLIESIDVKELKGYLLAKKIANKKQIQDLWSIRVLNQFIYNVLGGNESINYLNAMFVLYYLRVLSTHLSIDSFDEKYENCKERLGFVEGWYLDFHKCVITSTISMLEDIIELI